MFALVVSIEESGCSLKHAVAATDGSWLATDAAAVSARFLGKVLDGKVEKRKSGIEGRWQWF